MAFFDWKEEYAGGVESMDRDHREVLRLAADLWTGLGENAPATELLRRFDLAFAALQSTMSREESLLKEGGYPAYRFHKREHDDLTHILHEYRANLAGGSATLSLSALEFLGGWLISHFHSEDRCAGRFLVELAKAG